MSISTGIISSLELLGMVSGGYIGYKYGNQIKDSICKKYPVAEKFRKDYIVNRFKNSQISETTMFNMVGSFIGIFGGYRVWFVTIPLLAYQLSEDFPEEYKKIKKFTNKK